MIFKVFYLCDDDKHCVYNDLYCFNSMRELLEHFGPEKVIYATEVVGREEIKDFDFNFQPSLDKAAIMDLITKNINKGNIK